MILLQNLVVLLGITVCWQLLVSLLHLPNYILPQPTAVILALQHDASLIITHAWPTIIETLIGLLLGVMSGCLSALLMIRFRVVRYWLAPMLLISQAIPTFAIAPLMVLWFGFGMTSKIMITMLMLFFPVASQFYDGLNRVPSEWEDLMQISGATKWRCLRVIIIPSALPALASGIRVATALAPVGAIIGEWVGASRGLGYLMLTANARMQIDLVFAVLVVVIVISLMLYALVDRILTRWIDW